MHSQFCIGIIQVSAESNKDGSYHIHYANGTMNHMEAEEFEAIYLPMGVDTDGSTITEKVANNFVAFTQCVKMGEKTIVETATLINGFEITKTASSATVESFNVDIGREIAMKEIIKEVQYLLTFMLHSARKNNANLPNKK